MAKKGDLVEHMPYKAKAPALKAIYEDWGHKPDFKTGIVISTRQDFALVLPNGANKKPAWYQQEELEVLSAAR